MVFCISTSESNLDWYSKCQKQNSSAWLIPPFWIFAHQSAGVGIIMAYETILLFLGIQDIMQLNPLVTVVQLEFKCGHPPVWCSGCRVVSGCTAEAKWWQSINKDQVINISLFFEKVADLALHETTKSHSVNSKVSQPDQAHGVCSSGCQVVQLVVLEL